MSSAVGPDPPGGLDAVLTMIGRATFVLHPYIDRHPRSWTITQGDREGDLKVTHNRSLWDTLGGPRCMTCPIECDPA